MAEIHKIKKDGKTVFPVTTTKAVVDEEAKKTLNEILGEKMDKTSITQELGENEKLVLSQKGAKVLLQDRKEKDADGGYAGLDNEGKLDNRQLRRTNGYRFKSNTSILLPAFQFDFSENDFTFEIIFKHNVLETNWLFLQQTGSNYLGIQLSAGRSIIATVGPNIGNVGYVSNAFQKGVNYHLVFSRVGDNYCLYLDGQKISSVIKTGLTYPDINSAIILAAHASPNANIEISLFRTFNRGFIQSDVDYYWNNGQPNLGKLMYSDNDISINEIATNGNFENGLIGTKGDGGEAISTWTLNTVSPISGTKDGRLIVTTGASSSVTLPYLSLPYNLRQGGKYLISFAYKINIGTINSKIRIYDGASSRGPIESLEGYNRTVNRITFMIDMQTNANLGLYFDTSNNNLIDIQIDDISIKQVGAILELLPENATVKKWLGSQQKLDATASGNPALNFGDFYKKSDVQYKESFFEFLLSGSGAGAAYVRVLTNTTQVATIEGGYFVNSFGDLTDIGTQKTCSAGMLTYLYFKANKASGVIRIKDVSQMAYADRISDGPTMYSRSSNLPAQELFSGGGVVYAVSGNILMLPRTLTNLVLPSSAVALNGDLLDLPRGLTELTIKGTGEINGNILDLPKLLTILQLESTNTKITGNIKELPTNIKYLVITGINTLTGDIGLCECDFEFIYLTGLNTITYVNRSNIFKSSFSGLTWHPASAGILTSDMVDNLFIDMNTYITTAIGAKSIDFRGFCAAPTAASLDARNELASKGFTLYIN